MKLTIGSREIAVEQSPLRTSFYRSHNAFDLSRPSETCLLIKYHWGIRLFAYILCVMGWPVFAFAVMGLVGLFIQPEIANFVGVPLILLWGGVMLFMGVWLIGPRNRFDTATGQLTIRHFWRTRRRPLSEIIAVQVINAGKFESGYVEHGGGPERVFTSYQLNLVLDDPHASRLFVTYNDDLTDMSRKAQLLADFLHVPLLADSNVQTIVQQYAKNDATTKPDGSSPGRFRGSDGLRWMRDGLLPEPYRSWIDRTQPLPAQVKLLPRSVSVLTDLAFFVMLGIMFFGMDALMLTMFWDYLVRAFNQGEWGAILFIGGICLLLAIAPLVLLRRLFITLGASLDLKRGTLRQGILIGPQGVVVRLEANRGYVIPLDRFVNAKIVDQGDNQGTRVFVIETQDGKVDFFPERLNALPEQLNNYVKELRKKIP